MSFDIVSDIHLDKDNVWIPGDNRGDGLILAGDIFEIESQMEIGIKYLTYLSTLYECIIYIPGNHEFYNTNGTPIELLQDMLKEMCEEIPNIHILIDDIFEYKSYIFVGTTYYTHIYSSGKISPNNDFRFIYSDYDKLLTFDSMNDLHKQSKQKLLTNLENIKKCQDTIVVVVTHFNPGIVGSKIHVDDEQWIAYDSHDIFNSGLVDK